MSVYVYAIGSGTGHVKFGISQRPRERLKSVQVGCPVPCELLAVQAFPTRGTARIVETLIHLCLEPERTHGEWFVSGGKTESMIETLSRGLASRENLHPAQWRAVGT